MVDSNTVRPARRDEADRLKATLALAFSSDPIARWVATDTCQYLYSMLELVDPFGGRAALDHGTAHVVGDFLGAALWVPPGAHVDEEGIGEVFAKYVGQPRLDETSALFTKMANYHPKVPHWYLPLIGVDPAYHRQGLGSTLLKEGLALCDRDHEVAYLEATNRANCSLYQRHGFDIIGEIVVGGSPPLFPMLRQPR